MNNVWLLSNVLQRFWLYHHDRSHVLAKMYEFWCWNYLGGGVMSAFVFPSTTIAWVPHMFAVQLSGKAHEVFDYTAMIATMHWCLRAETHPGGKGVSIVIILCLLSGRHCLLNLNSMVVTYHVHWSELQASCVELYGQPLKETWVWAGGHKQSLTNHSQGQSKTWYQECAWLPLERIRKKHTLPRFIEFLVWYFAVLSCATRSLVGHENTQI